MDAVSFETKGAMLSTLTNSFVLIAYIEHHDKNTPSYDESTSHYDKSIPRYDKST